MAAWGSRQLLIVALAASFAGWTGYLVLQPRRALTADLSRGGYSDHYSHLNACRAFLFAGVDLWRVPLKDALPALTPDEREALDKAEYWVIGKPRSESYRLPGHSPRKPVSASWTHLPRPYPPGDLLAVLPAALLYEWTELGFGFANAMLIWLFVLYAHLALFCFVRASTAGVAFTIVSAALAYLVSMHWALEGFYDVSALVFLSLFGWALARKRWLEAVLAYSAAAFFHYRAFFFAPWVVVAAVSLVRSGAWRVFTRRQWWLVGLAALLSAASLGTFFMVWPSLGAFPLDNPVHASLPLEARVWFLALMLAGVVVFASLRSWVDVAMTVWLFVLLSSLRQCFAWHAVLLLPWLVMRSPWFEGRRASVADVARLALVVVLSLQVFHDALVPSWLGLLR